MADKAKTPKLRFPGFTDDWEQRKLSDVVGLFGGNAFSSSDSVNEGARWLKIANVGMGYVKWDEESFLPNSYIEKYPDYCLKHGDYVMALTRPILNKELKIAEITEENILLNQRVAKLLFTCDKKFGYQLLRKISTVEKIENELAGTDPPNLSVNTLTNIDVLIPSTNEQVKIGQYFENLDNLITLHQRKLDTIKKYKTGMLQKMFPRDGEDIPEVRFPGFTDPWEQRKFGEILDEFSNKSKTENEYPVLSSTNTGMEFRDGRVSGTSNVGYKIINNNDLVLSPQNLWLGNININDIGTGIVSPSYKTCKLKDIETDFFRPQIRTQYLMNEYYNASIQGASVVRRNLDNEKFNAISIFVPSSSEQVAIGCFFRNLDNLITLHQRKLDTIKELKKGLLQQMFV